MSGLIIDSFAGGGGASTGIEMALNRPVDIAINHDHAAIMMHQANHPHTKHYCEDVWEVDPIEATQGRPVQLMWLSPDCKHFSKAKGAAPVSKKIRGLAWLAVKWAKAVRPDVIMLENVEEFKTWGPLKDGRPHPEKKGQTFHLFVGQLKNLGYQVEWRELVASDYGAPTSRERFFMIARCDGQPIVWPEPTHGNPDSLMVRGGLLKPLRTAAEIIDWSIPCPSIFDRKKPLAENTLKRIARGLEKFVVKNDDPFIIPIGYGEREEQQPRVNSIREPLGTITSQGGHIAEVRAFLIKYYGQGTGQGVKSPLDTITGNDRFGLVTIKGEPYQIVDIGLRMLTPRELFNAQGFPADYIIDVGADGKAMTKKNQVAKVGNSVVPMLAEALVRANMTESAMTA